LKKYRPLPLHPTPPAAAEFDLKEKEQHGQLLEEEASKVCYPKLG
jgi:hypothetical protein